MIIPKISAPKKQKESSFNALAVDCPPTDNILTAEIAMVGEAPGDIEVIKKEPFVGPTGAQFNRICAAVRLARYKIYLTNACKAKFPKNNSNVLWTEKGYRHPDWSKLQAELIDELSKFPGKIIMLLGATPMRLLIDEPRFNSITKYRGSFYHAEDFPHLKEKLAGKIIGLSFHPSFTMPYGKPVHFYTMIADFTKALNIIEDPELLKDNTEIKIQPTLEEILQFYELIKTKKYVSFDIEATPEFITCFSFGVYHNDKIQAMSIPLMNNQGNYWTAEEEVKVWIGLAEILGSSTIGKICQNGMFDIMFTLRTMNIKTDNFYFDTMLAQHICYTELPKGLDYLTSAYTYYPYYKDEGKQSHLKAIKNWPQYWTYNAKDSAYLLPITEKLLEELEEFDSLDAMEYTMELHKPLMEMEFNGILTDTVGIDKKKKELEQKIFELQTELNELAGKELNTNSSKQMVAYFYGICMIKPYVNRKTGNATCGTVALHRIAKKDVKGSKEARLIIKIRKYQKLVSTYFNIAVDDDKRLRCNHKISGTVSGRIATEKTYFGTGSNLQNQPYIFKYFLIADPDWILCECDLAKAEAHVVAYLTQDVNMIQAFESGIDVHSFNASKIFNVDIDHVIEESKTKKVDQKATMRYMGKKVVHACVDEQTEVLTYLGWKKVSAVLSNEPIAIWNNKNKKIFFEVPKHWNEYYHNGDLLHFEGRTLDQLVTPNHKIPYYTSADNVFKKEYAKNIITRKNLRIPINGNYTGKNCYPASVVKLAVAIQADGSYKRNTRVRFHLKKQEKVISLLTILMELNIPFTHTRQANDNSTYISFPRSPVTDIYLFNKQFNWNLLELRGDYLDLFLDEILKWDGNIYKTKTGEFKRYQSTKKQNCDVVSTIAHLRGKQGIIRKLKNNNLYSVTFNETQKVGSHYTKSISYQGQIYCPTVSTGCFLMRRNNMISITGNSNYSMGPQTFSDNLAAEEVFKSQSECKRLLNNYSDRFPGLKRWHRTIEEEVKQNRVLYNLFGRPRRFLGDMNAALFRNAYSYKPQSTVAELLNKGMIKAVNDPRLGKDGFDIRCMTTVHDSFVFRFHKSQIPNLLRILLIIQDHMTYTFTYKGKSFTIGLDAKIGTQWAGNTAEISVFNQEEVNKAIKKIGF